MKARLRGFGCVEIDGTEYTHDVLIDRGKVRKRNKGLSKPFRGNLGHTPLSLAEDIPWGGHQVIIGTGVDGALPILPDVQDEADRRGINLTALPTGKACELIESLEGRDIRAILHITC